MSRVYKILSAQDWAQAKAVGRFEGAAIDLKDGFIHLSSADQVQETARLHFRGQEGLIVVAFETESLGAALTWEPSRGGALFPHLYAPLDVALAVDIQPLPLNGDGVPELAL